MKTSYAKTEKKAWQAISLAGLVLILATIIAANRQTSSFEQSILSAVYNLPTAITPLVYFVTQFGSVGAVIVVVVTALVLKRKKLAGLILKVTVKKSL